jgi:DNA polymerase-3 subunit gamma/tau
MVQLGARPEGLTDGFRQMLEQFKTRLAPGDALRMLKLAGEAEGAVRRSGNQRLVVETLLLRWAMMDRMVDLEKVLAGGPVGGGQGAAGPVGPAAGGQATAGPGNWRATVPKPEAAPPAPPAPAATLEPRAAAPDSIEFTPGAIRAIWSSVVEAVKTEKRMVGAALADTVLTEIAPPVVAVTLKEDNQMTAEALERGRGLIEQVLGGRVGAAVRLEIRPPESIAGAGVPRPRRRTDAGERAERLQQLRAKDPALDAVAEALDLEMTD